MDAVMNNAVLTSIQNFLDTIHYAVWFTWVPVILLGLCILSRFLCVLLTSFAPMKFGSEHRKVMGISSRTCYWLSLFAQAIIWIFGSMTHVALLGKVDMLVAVMLMSIALIALFIATIGMLFSRKGKRVFISKSLYSQAVMTLLLGGFIGAFGWVFMR